MLKTFRIIVEGIKVYKHSNFGEEIKNIFPKIVKFEVFQKNLNISTNIRDIKMISSELNCKFSGLSILVSIFYI
jgi:hypothetical protein